MERLQSNKGITSLNHDPASIVDMHRQSVPHEKHASPEPPSTPASSVRNDVQERGSQLRTQAQSDQTKFDQSAEIVETEDGTLASKKSQLSQAGRQVGRDAQSSFGDAKDAVKDIFKK